MSRLTQEIIYDEYRAFRCVINTPYKYTTLTLVDNYVFESVELNLDKNQLKDLIDMLESVRQDLISLEEPDKPKPPMNKPKPKMIIDL